MTYCFIWSWCPFREDHCNQCQLSFKLIDWLIAPTWQRTYPTARYPGKVLQIFHREKWIQILGNLKFEFSLRILNAFTVVWRCEYWVWGKYQNKLVLFHFDLILNWTEHQGLFNSFKVSLFNSPSLIKLYRYWKSIIIDYRIYPY